MDFYEQSEGFWGWVPSLERDIVEKLRPKHIYAGLMGKVTGNPSEYTEHTEGKMIPEFHDIWSMANLDKIADEGYVADVEQSRISAAYDAMEVLDFHKMFYALAVAKSRGVTYQGFVNVPWSEVW